jgi:hypothetical protein
MCESYPKIYAAKVMVRIGFNEEEKESFVQYAGQIYSQVFQKMSKNGRRH